MIGSSYCLTLAAGTMTFGAPTGRTMTTLGAAVAPTTLTWTSYMMSVVDPMPTVLHRRSVGFVLALEAGTSDTDASPNQSWPVARET